MSDRPLLLVSGVAEGLGASLAETFARAGHDVLGIARSDRAAAEIAARVRTAGGAYTPLQVDLTEPEAVARALAPHAERVAVLIHNAHALLIRPFEETAPAEFERIWRVCVLGAVAAAQTVLPHMAARGAGAVILTGATAGLRGGANFAAFASAKFALRGLAQSLAREYGPRGVHAAHVVLDGLIEEAQSDARFGKPQEPDARLDPDAVARIYLDLSRQHRSAWTQELDVRPFAERF